MADLTSWLSSTGPPDNQYTLDQSSSASPYNYGSSPHLPPLSMLDSEKLPPFIPVSGGWPTSAGLWRMWVSKVSCPPGSCDYRAGEYSCVNRYAPRAVIT